MTRHATSKYTIEINNMGPRIVHLTSSCCSEIVMVASYLGYRSSICFCQFIDLLGSMLINSHENGCNIALKIGKLESGPRIVLVLYPFVTSGHSRLFCSKVASHGDVYAS